jgi:hypothetical protein
MTLGLKKYKMNNQFNSIDQNKIKIICDKLCDKIEDVLDHFELEYRINNKFVSMACPIHNGDNDSALNLYYVGEDYKGNWKCRTHKCEEHFKGSIIGFIRGILSRQQYNWTKGGEQTVSFKQALDYATKLADIDINSIEVSKIDNNKNKFVHNTKIFISDKKENKPSITKHQVRKSLKIPSDYFISRGFSAEILDKYDVGDCTIDNKEMSGRAVVPIYDETGTNMLGCSGRAKCDKCDKCKSYHSTDICPDEYNIWKNSKWKHSSGIKTQECLYNIWNAKEYIQKLGFVILVESPGNVWKLEENNIHNSVALFGANLTDKQKILLDISGAMTIVAIMDSDDAGVKARELIDKKCSRTYNIRHITVSKNDIGEMNNTEIKNEIYDKIKDLL